MVIWTRDVFLFFVSFFAVFVCVCVYFLEHHKNINTLKAPKVAK